MKKLLLIVAFIGALTVTQSAQAGVQLLSGLYNSVSNQLFIVSNTAPVDKKLAKSLNAALAAIQKSGGGPDTASATKGLGSVVKIVNRTSVSNAVASSVHDTIVSIAGQYVGTANNFSNQLSTSFPSAAQTKALTGISNLLASVNGIGANPNLAAALKVLTGFTKQVLTIQKGVTAAQKAPAPASSVTATIVISGSPNFSFKAKQSVLQHTAGGNFLLNSSETTGSGTGTTLHSLAFGIYGLVSGANVVSGSDGEYSRVALNAGAGAFSVTTSSLQLNWDDAHKMVSGTFTLGLKEQGTGIRTGSVTGSFTLSYQ
jgi:hypothetical protein